MVQLCPIGSRQQAPGDRLRQVIDNALAFHEASLQELQIVVERDVDRQVADAWCPTSVEGYLMELLHAAIARSVTGGQLTLSACQTWRGLEIEVADGGNIADDVPLHAFSPYRDWSSSQRSERYRMSGGVDVEVYRTRCPQGGQACTLVISPRRAHIRAA